MEGNVKKGRKREGGREKLQRKWKEIGRGK